MSKVTGVIVKASLSLLCAGAIFGGVIVNEVNVRSTRRSTNIWKSMTMFLKDELFRSYDENDKLRKKLKERA